MTIKNKLYAVNMKRENIKIEIGNQSKKIKMLVRYCILISYYAI